MVNNKIIIYCDGACSGNQSSKNKGGWGAIVKSGEETKKLHGGEKNTTNQRMELTACIKGLESLASHKCTVDLYSDSAYLINCFNARWYVNWQKNGWLNARKQPVENKDLWEKLLALNGKHSITFHKVTGHSGVALNEMADGLARQGIAEL
jgi:ribonuclease HI